MSDDIKDWLEVSAVLRSDLLYSKQIDPANFLRIVRKAESLGLNIGRPILIYWSTNSVTRLLPKGPEFRDLMREAEFLSIFCCLDESALDESTFLMFTSKSSLFLDYKQVGKNEEKYFCSGSINQQETMNRYNELLPEFTEFDASESQRLEEYISENLVVKPDAQIFDDFHRDWSKNQNR